LPANRVVPLLSRMAARRSIGVLLLADKRDFTDRFLRSIKPAALGKRDVYYDAQIPGFGIRVTQSSTGENKGAFVLITRFPGSINPVPRRIGDYPAMSLAAARATARRWRELIAQGIDPKTKEAEQRRDEERRRADTFAAALEAFADDHLASLKTGKAVKKAIETHVIPHWGSSPVSKIRRADVAQLVRVLRKGMPIGTNRVLAYLKKMFNWLIDQDMIESSPAASIKRPGKEVKRDRVLSDFEIRAIWQACGELGAFGRAFKMMLATGQRRTEVGAMPWSEIDRGRMVWSLPRGRTKADRSHEIPLSALAISIIDDCPKIGKFVFSTGRRTSAMEPEPQPIVGWGKAKANLDVLALTKANAILAERQEEELSNFTDWHLHDLRRTAATNMAKLGIDRIVVAKVLNHAENEVTAVYDRHKYDAEKRRALELWGARIAAIVEEPRDDVVVKFSVTRPR
jgi:integrase